jgi:hypothetical protein
MNQALARSEERSRVDRAHRPTLRLARPALTIHAGERKRFTTDPAHPSLIAPSIRSTGDVDQFRAWMSVSGDRFQAGLDPIPSVFLPERPWARGADFTLQELTPAELVDLERAARIYVFGHRDLVADFRAAIVRRYAPFKAALYRAERVEVQAGGELVVEGLPALMEVDELIVEDGGSVTMLTPFRLWTDHLRAGNTRKGGS